MQAQHQCSGRNSFSLHPIAALASLLLLFGLLGCGDSGSPPPSPAASRAESEATTLGVPRERKVEVGQVTLLMEYIPSGEFTMGSAESKFAEDETPHHVAIERGFYLSKTEVTQAQYSGIVNTNPSAFMGADLPVENVSWDEATAYCTKVSELLHETVRLPTEAEWEYACRSGTTTKYYSGDDEAALAKAAYYVANSQDRTHATGRLAANAWGLCDMHGNVWEFCQDGRVVEVPDEKDPSKKTQTDCRMIRGGSWMDQPDFCRSFSRTIVKRPFRNPNIGFRVLIELKK